MLIKDNHKPYFASQGGRTKCCFCFTRGKFPCCCCSTGREKTRCCFCFPRGRFPCCCVTRRNINVVLVIYIMIICILFSLIYLLYFMTLSEDNLVTWESFQYFLSIFNLFLDFNDGYKLMEKKLLTHMIIISGP